MITVEKWQDMLDRTGTADADTFRRTVECINSGRAFLLRTLVGWSQEMVADHAGVSQPTWRVWEIKGIPKNSQKVHVIESVSPLLLGWEKNYGDKATEIMEANPDRSWRDLGARWGTFSAENPETSE